MNSTQTQGQADDPFIWGELVVRNGRHAGARRPLNGPVTLIGRAVGCDIRLQMEGVAAKHCVLAQSPYGPVLRDMHSEAGTLVNGERVQTAVLQEGDIVTVGVLQFTLQGLVSSASRAAASREEERLDAEAQAAARDALRVQVAAVAAQQIALEEEEIKLEQRRQALTQQEEQLATHLEEKRRKLLTLSEEAKAEREALNKERAAYENYIGKITGDLTQAQRELMEGQQQVEKQRQRLSDFNQRLKQRWHRFWVAERKKFRAQQADLVEQVDRFEERLRELQEKDDAVERKRLRFNSLYELGRGQMREAWSKLRQEQHRWKHRRGKERAALKVRERDLEQAERQLVHAQRLFLLDQKAWDGKKQALELELNGLDRRVNHQRLRILDGRDALRRLEVSLDQPASDAQASPTQPATELVVANLIPEPASLTDVGASPSQDDPHGPPAATQPALEGKSRKGKAGKGLNIAADRSISERSLKEHEGEWLRRLEELQGLSGALADQRLQLVDQWQRLALLFRAWQREKESAAVELEDLAQKLFRQGQVLAGKEEEQQALDANLKKRNEDVISLRHQMIAWRTRLRVREQAWEGERAKLLTEIRHRESLAEQQHAGLVDLRHRWSRHRKQELAQMHADREELEKLRTQAHQARSELLTRTTALEDEKRQLAEKALALEQFRQEILQKTEQATAERKLERFRRRWLTQNTVALRHIARERETLKQELAALDTRWAELQKRAESVTLAESQLAEKQSAWEHQQALTFTRQTRVQEELKHAELQRNLSEQQYLKMKEEVDRIARAIFAEPDTPAIWTAEIAA